MDTSCKPVSSIRSCLLGNGIWEQYLCITVSGYIEITKEAPLHLNYPIFELVYHSFNTRVK